MENYKELLTALYKEHAPDKIDQIDFYLNRYKGKEKQFYITQKAKYAKKRSVTDSKKILEEAMARIRAQKEKTAASKKTEVKKSITKPIIKKEIPKAPIIKESVLQEKKIAEIEKKDKPKIQDPPKKEKPIIIEKKKDVIILETSKKTTPKKDVKIEEKLEVKIVDTTASLNPSLKKSKDEIITSPLKTNKEELKPKAEEKETINKTTISDKEKKLLELKEAKERLVKSRKKEDKKPIAIWYIGAIALFVLIIASIVYFTNFYKNENSSKEPINVQKVVIENKKISTDQNPAPEKAKKEEKAPVEEVIVDKKEEPKEEPKEVPIKEPKKEPKKEVVKEKPIRKQVKTQQTADRLYSNDFSHPAVFVGCFAVKSESLAQKKVAQLKEHKLKAHYYWIPDMDSNGNEYFKVVIGPFDSLNTAYPSLTKVQERINFDAYIIILQ